LYGCQGSRELPGLLLAQTLDRTEQLSFRSFFQAPGLPAGLGQKLLGVLAGIVEPTVQLVLMLPEPRQGLHFSVL
jgi:hypothetical protein